MLIWVWNLLTLDAPVHDIHLWVPWLSHWIDESSPFETVHIALWVVQWTLCCYFKYFLNCWVQWNALFINQTIKHQSFSQIVSQIHSLICYNRFELKNPFKYTFPLNIFTFACDAKLFLSSRTTTNRQCIHRKLLFEQRLWLDSLPCKVYSIIPANSSECCYTAPSVNWMGILELVELRFNTSWTWEQISMCVGTSSQGIVYGK